MVAVAVVSAGVLFVGVSVEDGPPDPDTLRDRVAERNASLDAFEATVEVNIERANSTDRLAYRVATDRNGRLNVTYTAPDRRRGDVFVSNATGTYLYDRSGDRLVKRRPDAVDDGFLAPLVALVTDDDGTYEGRERLEGSSGVVLQYSAGADDVGLRIGGSAPASQFDVPGDAEPTAASVWVDPQLDLPVRVRQRYAGRNYSLTLEITDFEATDGFADGTFRVDVSPDTRYLDYSGKIQRYDSREALARAVSVSVPDASLPDGFSVTRGMAMGTPDNRTVAIVYEGDLGSVLVSKHVPPHPHDADGQSVVVDGVEGSYHVAGTSGKVTWQCSGATYQVTGTLGKDQLLAIARSIGCERSGSGRLREAVSRTFNSAGSR